MSYWSNVFAVSRKTRPCMTLFRIDNVDHDRGVNRGGKRVPRPLHPLWPPEAPVVGVAPTRFQQGNHNSRRLSFVHEVVADNVDAEQIRERLRRPLNHLLELSLEAKFRGERARFRRN